MEKIFQKTIANQISFAGIGLHTGKFANLKILPSKADTGITFKRVDLKKNNLIKADYKNVKSATLCTTLENDHGVKVSTIEHLMAALYIGQIDNVIVEIDNEEVPIMDGSAKDFLNSLKISGTKQLPKERKYLKILEEIKLTDGKREISITPHDTLEIDFQLDYRNNALIGKQRNIVNFHKDDLSDISNSRTFCLYEDLEKIKKMGLAKGGSLDNAIVVDADKVINSDGLRNDKEFVNHKILDLVGDLLLSNYRILGKIKCYKGGHELTNLFLRKLLSSKTSTVSSENNQFKKLKKYVQNQVTKLAVNA